MAKLQTTYIAQRTDAATNTTRATKASDDWRTLTTELERPASLQYRESPYFKAAVRQYAQPYHQFPSERCLMSLARAAQFPATSSDMIAFAEHRGCSHPTVLFLRLFGLRDTFENGIDFLNRCEEVKLFLCQERSVPYGLLRSSARLEQRSRSYARA